MVTPGVVDVPWSCAVQKQISLCLQKDAFLIYPAPTHSLFGVGGSPVFLVDSGLGEAS